MQINNLLREIYYIDLKLWDVKRLYINELHSRFPIISLKKLIEERNEKVKPFEDPEELFKILGVNNKEGIFDAYIVKGKEIKQPYKKVFNNDLAYNPYRVNVGSIGMKTSQQENQYISPAYVVFKTNEELLSEFLYRMFKTDSFNKIIRDNTTGSVRQNLTFNNFSNIKIPLPPITEQQRIVDTYNQKISQAEEFEIEANEIEKNIQKYLFEILGIKFSEKEKENKSFKLIDFKDVERWSVDYLSNFNTIKEMLQGKFEPIKFGELINSFQYGLSEKSTKEPVGFPMLRMNNIYDGETIFDDLKYIKIEDNTFKKYRLEKGDLLFNRTNSKELVGKTSIFVSDEDYTFASYIIRVKLNKEKVDINYINFLFNSKILQIQKDMISRQILGQANINSKEMQNFLFPIPPLEIQKEITETVQKMKSKIKQFRSQAKANREQAINDFEKEIITDEN